MTEFAVLLPVYVLLLIGIIYFSNEVLIWQESAQAARFLASNTRAGAPSGGGGASLIALTGANIPQDYFISMTGSKAITVDSQPGDYTQQQIRDELIKISWAVNQTFDLQGKVATSRNLTGPGNIVYKKGVYDFNGDDALIASEISDWFHRGSSTVTLTYDSPYIHVGKWTLPAASVTAQGSVVARSASDKQRSLTQSRSGLRKPIEDLIQQFGPSEAPSGSLPMPDYPNFMNSDPFWVPN